MESKNVGATIEREVIMKRGTVTSDKYAGETYRIDLPESEIELRDYFAAHAVHCFQLDDASINVIIRGAGTPMHEVVAKFCYDFADAMMKERRR